MVDERSQAGSSKKTKSDHEVKMGETHGVFVAAQMEVKPHRGEGALG